jgi:hypothetical protein
MPVQQFREFGTYGRCPRVALGAVLELATVTLVAVICPAASGVRRGVAELELAPSIRARRIFPFFGCCIPFYTGRF